VFLNQPEFDLAESTSVNVYPNPTSRDVTLSYSLSEPAFVSIYVYDLNGRIIKKLVRENQAAGTQNVTWDGTNENGTEASSGIYFYSALINGKSNSGKLILNR